MARPRRSGGRLEQNSGQFLVLVIVVLQMLEKVLASSSHNRLSSLIQVSINL